MALNKYYLKGKKAKELLNLDNRYNPYPLLTREHILWQMGNSYGIYIEEKYEAIELIDNEDFFDYDTNRN